MSPSHTHNIPLTHKSTRRRSLSPLFPLFLNLEKNNLTCCYNNLLLPLPPPVLEHARNAHTHTPPFHPHTHGHGMWYIYIYISVHTRQDEQNAHMYDTILNSLGRCPPPPSFSLDLVERCSLATVVDATPPAPGIDDAASVVVVSSLPPPKTFFLNNRFIMM